MSYHVGDIWEPTATVTDPKNGEAIVEPGSITFTVEQPNGKTRTVSATKVSTGVWEAKIELTEAGIWKVIVTTTSPYQATQPGEVSVKPRDEP